MDPEAVRFLNFVTGGGSSSQTIIWTSEGYAKGGVQPAVYEWTMREDRAKRWRLPDAFLHDDSKNPTRGIFHNNGFESLAIDHWGEGPVAYTAVERPLIQDEGTDVCRVLARSIDGSRVYQYGYPLGPARGHSPRDARRRRVALRGPALPRARERGAPRWRDRRHALVDEHRRRGDLSGIDSLKDLSGDAPRYIEKKLLLDFSTLPNNEGIGNFEGMDDHDGKLFFVEDNEHGKAGSTRMLVFTKPNGLEK